MRGQHGIALLVVLVILLAVGASSVRSSGSCSATFIVPYGAAEGRPRVHLAAGRGIWFATPGVAINDGPLPSDLTPGPGEPSGAVVPVRTAVTPLRILLGDDAALMVGSEYRRVSASELRSMGVAADGTVRRSALFPPAPIADRAFYRAAAANTANAAINQAAGEAAGDDALARKRDSLYTQAVFQQVQTYLQSGRVTPRLRGVVYVAGGVSLLEGQRLHVADGALITEHTVELHPGARLEVTHTASSRTYPGLMVLGEGVLFVHPRARLLVHGLVYVSRLIDASPGALLDVVGAIIGADPNVSFRSDGAQVVIRYDSAILGTTGLRVAHGTPPIAWVAAWEELL